MEGEKIFEYATRNKVRFPYKGSISVEDLWDLSVTDLDQIFKTLNAKLKQSQEESLLDIKTKEKKVLDIQIAIVRYIVSVKLEEKEARKKEAAKKEQKQKIMSIIAEKKEEALKNNSIEELQKMLDELNE